MIEIQDLGIILEKSENSFESTGVLNPACIQVDGITHMFYRAIQGQNYSSIGYCQLKDGEVIYRSKEPILLPEQDYEKSGVEDPRVVLFEGIYYLFYTAYDGKNALLAYAISNQLPNFTKQGLISPKRSYKDIQQIFSKLTLPEKYVWYSEHYQESVAPDVLVWDKDSFIFPERINDKIALVLRIMPGIQIAYFNDFAELKEEYWQKYFSEFSKYIILDPKYWYESRKIGGGCPPIKTADGWLFIYHASEDNPKGRIYHASAALLDLKDPSKVLYRLPNPLFSPGNEWEMASDGTKIVFPTGTVVEGEDLYIYYGAADLRICAKKMKLRDLIDELKQHPYEP